MDSWKCIVLLFYQILLTSPWVTADLKTRSELEKEILQNIFLGNKFQMYVRPDKNMTVTTDEPLDVGVSLHILSVNVDLTREECTLKMYFRQEWNDSRLAYSDLGNISVVSFHDTVGFWTPDLFFVNEKSAYQHTITKPNTFVRVYPQGRVLYSQRLTLTVESPVNLKNYPFDTQTCKFEIESYGFTTKDLMLKWRPDDSGRIVGFSSIAPFRVTLMTEEKIIHGEKASYSRLVCGIYLNRLPHSHIIHIYIPMVLLVALSWVSFWLRPFPHLLRLAAAVIMTLVTLMFLQSIKGFFYPQNYFTALDIWVGFCSLLIFASVLESFYVMATYDSLKSTISQTNDVKSAKEVPELPNGEKGQRKLKDILAGNFFTEESKLDVIFRMAFPSVFVLFNIIYLAYYLQYNAQIEA